MIDNNSSQLGAAPQARPRSEADPMRMGAYARWYHQLDWPVIAVHYPVFQPDGATVCSCPRGAACPEKSRGKHPVNSGWQKLEKLARDGGEIADQWKRTPFANIGVPTGDAWGLFILDADGDEGVGSVRQLVERLGPLPATPRQRTGGGGLQWFFRAPGLGLPNSVARLAPKVDTRGEGGQGVVAPSLHRSRRRYRWEVLPTATPLADLTKEWIAYMTETLAEPAPLRAPRRGYGREGQVPSITTTQAKRLLIQMLDHPLIRWAVAHPELVNREVWRGIATNLVIPALEYPVLEDFVREAFHLISQDHPSYTSTETDREFDGALVSAASHGPMTFQHMQSNGAPAAVAIGGTSIIHAARRNLSIF